MERAGSQMDMDGRPRTPNGGENAPSPSKRPRIDGPQFPAQAMMNGRFQGMPGQQGMRPDLSASAQHTHQLLMEHGINPMNLSQSQLQSFQGQNPQMQEKTIKAFASNFPQRQNMQGMIAAAQGGPMMQPMNDEYFATNHMRPGPGVQNGANQNGNHALQDYQMQLMLLEQQNKKRLLMARQEQDSMRPTDGQMVNQPGAGFTPTMSPQGSRSGPSPNPNEMKREDTKMGQMGLPGSPMPDGAMPPNRGSPGPMNFNGQNMSAEMMQKMQSMEGVQMPGAVRPPTTHPVFAGGMPNGQQGNMDMRTAAQQQQQPGRMPNGANWPQGLQGQAPNVPQQPPGQQPLQQPPQPGHPGGQPPQQPGQSAGQQGPMGTPQQHNAVMPPPPNVPAATNQSGARPQSPANQNQTAGTPQQSNKPNPKKSTAEKKKVRPKFIR